MNKLNRLGWTNQMAISSYGVTIGIRSSLPKTFLRLPEYLPPGWRSTSSPRVDQIYSFFDGRLLASSNIQRMNLLYRNHLRIFANKDPDVLLETFQRDIQQFVAEKAKNKIFIHAGVVGWKNGAIVIPGRSLSGKSTLVAEFIRCGATYFSDEYAIFDPQGRVHPFPRPLALRGPLGAPYKNSAKFNLNTSAGKKPIKVRLVISTEYHQEAHWNPVEGSAGQGVLALASNAVSGRDKPAFLINALCRAVSQSSVLIGPRGEAAKASRAILQYLDKQKRDA